MSKIFIQKIPLPAHDNGALKMAARLHDGVRNRHGSWIAVPSAFGFRCDPDEQPVLAARNVGINFFHACMVTQA